MIERLAARWNEFCFAPLAPTRLAICRFLIYMGLYWAWFGRPSIVNPNYATVGLPDEFFFPQNIFRYILIASPEQIGVLTLLLKIALVLGALGLLTRVTTVVVFGLVFYLISLPSMFGKVVLINAIPVVVTGFLALSRCGDAWSLDRLLRDRWRRWPLTAANPQPSAHYRWPIQLISIYLAMTFCLAAISKLINSGIAWIFSDNLSLLLRTTLANQACIPTGGPSRIPELGTWVGEHPMLCRLLAGVVFSLELAAPLLLVLPALLRYLLLAGMAISAVSFYFMVGVDALPIILVLVVFVPWDQPAGWVRQRLARGD